MPSLPAILQKQAESAVAQLGYSIGAFSLSEQLVLACSDFVLDNLRQYPAWRQNLQQQPPVATEYQSYEAWLNNRISAEQTEASMMRILRLFRREMLLRIAWMQWLKMATTEQSLQQLSNLAKVLISQAKAFAYSQCCREMGTPYGNNGQPQQLCILGMGKLGGDELNFSSDIDLIFLGRNTVSPVAVIVSLIISNSSPAWGSCSFVYLISQPKMALSIGSICDYVRLVIVGR